MWAFSPSLPFSAELSEGRQKGKSAGSIRLGLEVEPS
jgi:hypothetical protein